MEMSKRVLGEEHPHTLTSMANLAFTWKGYGRHTDALKVIEECVQLQLSDDNHVLSALSSFLGTTALGTTAPRNVAQHFSVY